MRALEPLRGIRVVADPAALDAASWTTGDGAGDIIVLRTAADEAFGIGAASVELADAAAIVEPEAGFAGVRLGAAELVSRVLPHLEWEPPHERPALGQGMVAGVPAKIWLAADGSALLVTMAVYAHELEARLR